MDRRTFVHTMGALTMIPEAMPQDAGAGKRRVYLLEQYFLKNGTQAARLHDHFSNAAMPAMKRAGAGPAIVLEALVAPHMPQVAAIVQFESMEHLWSVGPKILADKELGKAVDIWESHAEQPYEHLTTTLLEAAPYSPELTLEREPRKSPRIFELRVYHSPTGRQLRALHERFAGPEIRIFHRVGVHPLLYTSTLVGQNMPNLTYLTPFDDLAAREKAWAAFGADPEWIKVRKESIDKHGQISSVIQIALYRATPYSPIR